LNRCRTPCEWARPDTTRHPIPNRDCPRYQRAGSFLVEDGEKQTALATTLIGRSIAHGEPLFVSDVVVCETVWVLSSSYKTPRGQIVSLLRSLFRARHLEFAAVDQLVRALEDYREGCSDFANYIIRQHARSCECDSVATFVAVLLKERGFLAVR